MKIKYTETGRDSGLTSFCSWERLLPHLNDAINRRQHEQIGLVEVTEHGLQVYIDSADARRLRDPEVTK